jgi:hypothetical protein
MKKLLTILLLSNCFFSNSFAQEKLNKNDIAKINFLVEKTTEKFHLKTDEQEDLKLIFEQRFLAYKNDWAPIKNSGDDIGAAAKGKEISEKCAKAAIEVLKCKLMDYWNFMKDIEPEMKNIKG